MKLKPVSSVALQDYNMHTVMGMDDMTGQFTLGISSATFIDPSLANSMDAYTLVVRGQAGEGGSGGVERVLRTVAVVAISLDSPAGVECVPSGNRW